MFDSLTDLVEHFKKIGIEEVSGTFVYLKQVNGGFVYFCILEGFALHPTLSISPLSPHHTRYIKRGLSHLAGATPIMS